MAASPGLNSAATSTASCEATLESTRQIPASTTVLFGWERKSVQYPSTATRSPPSGIVGIAASAGPLAGTGSIAIHIRDLNPKSCTSANTRQPTPASQALRSGSKVSVLDGVAIPGVSPPEAVGGTLTILTPGGEPPSEGLLAPHGFQAATARPRASSATTRRNPGPGRPRSRVRTTCSRGGAGPPAAGPVTSRRDRPFAPSHSRAGRPPARPGRSVPSGVRTRGGRCSAPGARSAPRAAWSCSGR